MRLRLVAVLALATACGDAAPPSAPPLAMPAGFVVHAYRVTAGDGEALDDDARDDLVAALPHRIDRKIEQQILARFTTPDTLELGHAPGIPLDEDALRAIVERPFTFSFRIFVREASQVEAQRQVDLGDLAPPLPTDPGTEWLLETPRPGGTPRAMLVGDLESAGLVARSVARTEVLRGARGEEVVYIEAVDGEASDHLEQWTGAHLGDSLAIELDGYIDSSPRINDVLPGRTALSGGVHGGYREAEAKAVAAYIRVARRPPVIERIE